MSQAICFYCGLPAKWRCDHPRLGAAPLTICGRLLCNACRRVMGRNEDHCKTHLPVEGSPP